MKLKKILETSFTLQPKDDNQKLDIYKCKHCGQTYARHITRMSLHLLKCAGCPGAVKEMLKEKVKNKTLEISKLGFNKKGQVKNLKKILEENFLQIPRDGNQKLDTFKCKHCEQKYARNASRMSLHLQKCSDCPEAVKHALEMNAREGMAHKVTRKLIPKKLLDSSFVLQPKEPNQKLQTFKCKYCGQIYARHSTRMSLHLQKCIGCPPTLKASIKEKGKSWKGPKITEINFKRRMSDTEETPGEDDVGMQMPSVSHAGIPESNYIGKMSKQRQKYCEELLAKAIYASNAPVSIVDNEHWRTLLSTLSPAFELPTQQQLSSTLLDTTYESVKKSVDQKVREAVSLGLQCSYRSTPGNGGILHFVLTTPDPVLYKSISIASSEEDEQLYMAKISEVIEEVGPGRVLGVCLDSISTCENLWELLQQKYEEHNISFYYCSSQTLDRLLKEISDLQSISSLLTNTTSMIKELRQLEVVLSTLSDAQKNSDRSHNNLWLKMPGLKKWSTFLLSLDSLLDNKDDLQAIALLSRSEKCISKASKELISDEEYWNKIHSYDKLIRPIIKWINHLADEDAKISEVPEMFADLEQHFLTEFQEPLLLLTVDESNQILKRFKTMSTSLLQDIHYAANLLNPIFKGERLSPSETSQGQDLITKLSTKFGMPEKDIMIDLAEYNAGSGVWGVNFVKKSATLMTPSTWWRGFFKNSFLTRIAASILDLPSTSVATTDRSFRKNIVKDDPTGKIMYINQNLRLLDPKRNEKNKTNREEDTIEDAGDDEYTVKNMEAYSNDIEEVLVEEPEESMEEEEEEAEEITADIREDTTNQVPNHEIYVQIYDDSGKAYLVQQVPQNISM